MPQAFQNWLAEQGISTAIIALLAYGYAALLMAGLALAATWIARGWLVPLLERAVRNSSNQWDDTLATNGFFRRLATLLPTIALYFAIDLFFPPAGGLGELLRRLILSLFVVLSLRVLDALLHSANDLYTASGLDKGKPIKGYLQAIAIIAYIIAAICIIAILTGKSPWGLLTLFGGLTAVVILVFKDTILGFIASIQLTAHDMVRVGDWIEVPKYGADGDVIDVTIHTVKVRNWDKTIVTIPTYGLVSDSFKNWRGMKESGGRRIKRAIYLDMNSITFCDPAMLERFREIDLVREYLTAKEAEIAAYNASHQVNPSHPINGRKQTNLGIFRAYITRYLRQHPKIHQEMTFLIRHLPPTSQGLPMEIYVFSREQAWADYEALQADIFDHILAAVPFFGLRIFQYPAGHDLRLAKGSDFSPPPA